MPKLLRQNLLQLSTQWLDDARILLAAGRFAGAYHAGGVSLECLLKARIAAGTQAEEFPDKKFADRVWTHQPVELLKAGGLVAFLDQAPSAIQANWTTVKDWTIDSRYNHIVDRVVAEAFLDALDDQTNGVLPWLRSHC